MIRFPIVNQKLTEDADKNGNSEELHFIWGLSSNPSLHFFNNKTSIKKVG